MKRMSRTHLQIHATMGLSGHLQFWTTIIFFCQIGVATARSLSNAESTEKLVNFLQYHGYADGYGERTQLTLQEIEGALVKFQQFFGLPITGILDERTQEEMQKKRCDVPDLRVPRYTLKGRKWIRDITWRLDETHPDIPTADALRVIRQALKVWTSQMSLKVTESTAANAVILFKFVFPDSGGYHNGDTMPFKNTTLAHAFYPAESRLAGDVHVNMKFTFATVEPPLRTSFSLLTLLVHELGHSLGLAHTNISDAVMFPTSLRGAPFRGLHSDDILGIQAIYGETLVNGSLPPSPSWMILTILLMTTFEILSYVPLSIHL